MERLASLENSLKNKSAEIKALSGNHGRSIVDSEGAKTPAENRFPESESQHAAAETRYIETEDQVAAKKVHLTVSLN